MPADIIGTNILVEDGGGRRQFQFQPGPIFANLVLADEINRATPKTQSALLEAMQEHQVTVAGARHPLDEPFFVLATQNPIEMEGTYPLPEAQLDRFMFKVHVPFPDRGRPRSRSSTARPGPSTPAAADAAAAAARRPGDAARWRASVPDRPARDGATPSRLLAATHPDQPRGARASSATTSATAARPRGAQALVLAAKVRALLDGRFNVAVRGPPGGRACRPCATA